MTNLDRQKEFVLRTIEERDLRFVRLWFTDILGFLKSVALAPAELENAFEDGIGFDGSSINGNARITESDSLAIPDASTFNVLPWKDNLGKQHSARMFCDILQPDGAPAWSDSRNILRKQLAAASKRGFNCYVHPEIEFFLLKDLEQTGNVPTPTDLGGFFDQTVHEYAPEFRRYTVDALESMGIPVEFSHHESAPGQQEIDLRFADALSMADNIMTFRYIIKVVAMQQGVMASFMPKPFSEHPGSAMHSHFSLFEGDINAFYGPDDELLLSPIAKQFIAGVLHYSHEISAVTNQWVNSYRRLIPGGEAPFSAYWGVANRAAMLRVPMFSREKSVNRRVEVRTLDSACNPYLAYAVILAAGLEGIKHKMTLPEMAPVNTWSLSAAQRKELGYRDLPHNLAEALVHMEKSELMAQVLGDEVFDYFLRNKWDEWNSFNVQVTPFETTSYINL